jgi:GH25 family lysozyme M1 (1,4-beta-N-acetylmuramidase)
VSGPGGPGARRTSRPGRNLGSGEQEARAGGSRQRRQGPGPSPRPPRSRRAAVAFGALAGLAGLTAAAITISQGSSHQASQSASRAGTSSEAGVFRGSGSGAGTTSGSGTSLGTGTTSGSGSTQKVDHSNVGATHSPQVLRQLTAISSSTTQSSVIAGALQGVDVASFQHPNGATIDWNAVSQAGKQFAAVKATEGAYYQNHYALDDLAQAKAQGLSVMGYAFAIPNGNGSSASPVDQADYLIDYLATGSAGVPTILLDIEYNPYGAECYGLSQSAMVTWISQFNAEVQKRTGQQPIIYTPRGWWTDCTGGSAAFSQIPLWEPYISSGATSPILVTGWQNWAFWQYGTGTVSGISGSTDLDQLNPALIPLLNPGPQKHRVGSPVGLQVKPADPVSGQTLSFTATGLPAGVSMSSSGQITGWPLTPGTYTATVTASDGAGLSGSFSFPWTITIPADAGPAGMVRLDFDGKCLNDVGNLSADGTQADIWTCNGGTAQLWTYVQDGTLRIHGKCLTVPSGSASGAKVVLGSCTDIGRQKWRVVYPRSVNPSAGSVATTLYNPTSGMCMTDPAFSKTNGTRVVVSSCNGQRDESWALPGGPAASGIPGKCLDDSGNLTTAGNKIDIYSCNGGTGQQWTLKPDATVRVHGMCLDVAGSATASASPVVLNTCGGAASQQWHLVQHGGGAQIVNAASGLCLADPADSTTNGTQLQISACVTGDPGMAWRVS